MGQALDLAVESAGEEDKNDFIYDNSSESNGTSPIVNSDSSSDSDSELIFKVPTRTYARQMHRPIEVSREAVGSADTPAAEIEVSPAAASDEAQGDAPGKSIDSINHTRPKF